jgi:hypothetical protein
MLEEPTDVVRRFNRTYTQRIGALDESFLGTGRPLGPSRLLVEIGESGATVRELRDRPDRARAHGKAVVRLLTNDSLTESIAMYARAGYRANSM